MFLNRENAEKFVLPLAAIAQCAKLVSEVAQTGKLDYELADPLLESVLALDAPDVESVYGGAGKLRTGLLLVCEQLNVALPRHDVRVGRIVANLINLERQLGSRRDMQDVLRTRLQQAIRLRTHQPEDDDALIANLAGIYSDTLSTLPLRIQVSGEARHLQAKENQSRIRALLLCGIRSAVLWRQLGGRRRHFVLSRKVVFEAARAVLRRIDGKPA